MQGRVVDRRTLQSVVAMEGRLSVVEDEREVTQPGTPDFKALFLAQYPAVLSHLIYLVGDRHLAEDLA